MIEKKINSDLYLKLLEKEDAYRLFDIINFNREYLRCWLPWLDHTKDVEYIKQNIEEANEKYNNNMGFELGIWYKSCLVGVIGIHEINLKEQKTAISYWLAEEYQGNGIITNSVKFVISYVFKEIKLKKIEIRCAVDNKKSRAIPERLGFKFESIKELAENLYGKIHDHAIYSIEINQYNQNYLKFNT